MTKAEVLSGVEFKLRSNGTSTYKVGDELLTKTIYTQHGDKCLEDYEANIKKVGPKTISFYTFVVGKRVDVKLRYEDLIPYQPQIESGEGEIIPTQV